MKKLILLIAVTGISATTMFAQNFMTRTGRASFNATAKNSPEKIEAVNNEVSSVVSASGDLVFSILVKSFRFERQLMQEHFNENYMESDKFPKADFKGKVADVNFAKDGTYNTVATGKLTIHGVSNDVSVPGIVTVKGSSVNLKAKFSVKLADYKIAVPSVVSDKVGNAAAINIDCSLNKK